MVLEAGMRDQRIDSMRETSGALAESGVFVPFGNVVKRFSWTPDAGVVGRRGIGGWDPTAFDTGPESHSVGISYLLQGPMVVAATLDTGDVAGASAEDGIKWTAVKGGFDANDITVTLIAGTADADGITVIDKAITCEVGTAIADDLCTLLNANADVAALVTCATLATTTATGTVDPQTVESLTDGVSTPLSEAFQRDCDGQLEARTIVKREKHCEGGTAGAGKRTYEVIEGCKPASARIPGDPGTPGPIEVEITYTAEKGRSYEISQPNTAGVLFVTSSEAADYAATVTVEDDDGNQEEIVVSGTGSTEFSSIDAIELASELTGTLTVQMATAAGATLAVIFGSNDYANAEGDLGVPVLPASGSRTTTKAGTYEKFLGDTIEQTSASLAYDINSAEMAVDNSVTARPRSNTRKQRILEGNRAVTLNATVMGENEYFTKVVKHLQVPSADIVWALTNTTLTLNGAVLTSIGDKTTEEGAAFLAFDNTFTGTSVTIA